MRSLPGRALPGGLLGIGAAVLLVACTPAPAVTVTAGPAPAPTVVITVTPTAAPAPLPTAAPAPVVPDVPNASAPEVVEGPADDLGEAPAARGSTTSDADGNLLSYTVVADDAFFDIAQRFDLPQQQLLRMNPSIPDFGETLYIGQVINLDWTTTK